MTRSAGCCPTPERNMPHCPHCNKAIYNRRRDRCEFCEKPLPKELLLSPEQRAKLDAMKEVERKRLTEWKQEMDRRTDHSEGGSPFGI